MRIDRAPPCTTTRSVGRVPPDGLVTWTPARRVVRVVGSVRGGRGPGGDAAIVTRPGRSQAGWGGPHQGDDQQPANLGHGEREQAELADQAAASPLRRRRWWPWCGDHQEGVGQQRQGDMPVPAWPAAPRSDPGPPRPWPAGSLRGLLGPVGCKNGWQLAEHAGERTPDGMQRLMSDQGEGRRRWRALDLGVVRAFLEADAPQVPWARHDRGFSRAFEDTAAWLAVHTSRVAVAELLWVAWRTVGRIVAGWPRRPRPARASIVWLGWGASASTRSATSAATAT